MTNALKTTDKPGKTRKARYRPTGKPMGRPPIPDLQRVRTTAIALRPFHHYVASIVASELRNPPRKNSGRSNAIALLIEEEAKRRGLSEDDFMEMPDAGEYAIGNLSRHQR